MIRFYKVKEHLELIESRSVFPPLVCWQYGYFGLWNGPYKYHGLWIRGNSMCGFSYHLLWMTSKSISATLTSHFLSWPLFLAIWRTSLLGNITNTKKQKTKKTPKTWRDSFEADKNLSLFYFFKHLYWGMIDSQGDCSVYIWVWLDECTCETITAIKVIDILITAESFLVSFFLCVW